VPDEPKVGLFQERSHHIVDIPGCLIHHPVINEAAAAVKDAIRETGVSVYHDVRHAGLVRYLQCVIERGSGAAQLVVVCNGESSEDAGLLWDAIASRLGGRLHSLWFNGNTAKQNTILGPVWQQLSGPLAVEEQLGGAQVFFPPDAFGQANLGLFDVILDKLYGWVPQAGHVVEYHAGVGAIGLSLLGSSRAVDFVEVAPGGVRGLRMGLACLAPEQQQRARVFQGAAREHTELIQAADTVIVDPPRKGLEPNLVDALSFHAPERLIYLSCGLDAFERDARALIASGRMRMRQLVPYALVPFTDHVETLALFEGV
jgi:tRNA/tmRNA/rRNA uracil-C5-methylase (TrmA/RlmC/RlmD family)